MSIVIKAERIHGVNGDAWKILEAEMLEKDRLPEEYINYSHAFVYREYIGGVSVINWNGGKCGTGHGQAREGAELSIEKFDSLVEACRLAGERLAEIHKRIWSPSWTGVETFVI